MPAALHSSARTLRPLAAVLSPRPLPPAHLLDHPDLAMQSAHRRDGELLVGRAVGAVMFEVNGRCRSVVFARLG